MSALSQTRPAMAPGCLTYAIAVWGAIAAAILAAVGVL